MVNSDTLTAEQLAAMFDHTNLHADARDDDFRTLCQEAADHGFAMVAINPGPVALCKQLLGDAPVHVGAAIGFPLGQNTVAVKVAETRDAIANGADEIDYVINVGQLRDGHDDYIRDEMHQIVEVCRQAGVLSKVIFETCYLTDDEITRVAEIAREVGPDFVKTSTGFGTAGATAEHVRLMKDVVGDQVKVKAAGGVRSWQTCKAMIDAGAERIGTSSSLTILREFQQATGR